MDRDKLLDAAEVAKVIGYSKRHVYRLVEVGQLPAERVGCRLVFRREAIEQYLKTVGCRANGIDW